MLLVDDTKWCEVLSFDPTNDERVSGFPETSDKI